VAQYLSFLLVSGNRSEARRELVRLRRAIVNATSNAPNAIISYASTLATFGFEAEARSELDALAKYLDRSEEVSTTDVAKCIRLYLKFDSIDVAERWLEILKCRLPDAASTTLLEIKWLSAADRANEIPSLLKDYENQRLLKAKDDNVQEANLYLTLGQLYTAAKLDVEAARWFESLARIVPTGYLLLAKCYARLERLDDVFTACEQAVPGIGKPRAATALAGLLTQVQSASDDDFARAHRFVSEAMASNPQSIELKLAAASLFAKQHRVDKAIELYDDVLRDNPRNLIALNNVATLLAEQSGRIDDALHFIDRAIASAGVIPLLMDTKGMVLYHAGRSEEAIMALKMACWSLETDPRYWFHLALAADAVGDSEQSGRALKQALEDGLEDQFLTPGDIEHLARLRRQYKSQEVSANEPSL
jgi:tetratricopeptide (TPR) repeat protein